MSIEAVIGGCVGACKASCIPHACREPHAKGARWLAYLLFTVDAGEPLR